MSAFGTLNWKDLGKGALVAAIGAILGAISPALAAGGITVAVLQAAGGTGLAAGLAYLSKNLITNSDGNIGTEGK